MSKPRFTQANGCCWAITALCCVSSLRASDGTADGLGKLDAQPNRLRGQVILANGQPAERATIHVRGHEQSGIDAHINADDQAHFEFVVRYPSDALAQLQIIASSQDGQ